MQERYSDDVPSQNIKDVEEVRRSGRPAVGDLGKFYASLLKEAAKELSREPFKPQGFTHHKISIHKLP